VIHAGNHYIGLYELQAKKLYVQQEQAQQSGPLGEEEILQILQFSSASS
jgi:hypothetical protein